MQLVAFRNHWDRIKTSIITEGPQRDEIIGYIEQPKRGRNLVSYAKGIICAKLDITSARFNSLYQASHIPAAMVKSFGWGSILFMPKGRTM